MPNFARIICYLSNALRRVYWPENRLRKYQEENLRSVVRYAYKNVRFYHDRLKSARILPADIRTVNDLKKLPVFHKDEIRRTSAAQLLSINATRDRLKMMMTSGSSGKPFRFYVNKKEDDWRKAIYLRANISCGQRPRDRWVFLTSPRHIGDTTRIQLRLRVFAQQCVSIFTTVEKQLDSVMHLNPDVLDGYSGALFLLAKEADRRNMTEIRPRLMFGSADLIDLSQSRYMERIFGASYLDQFGCAEVDRTAWQCPLKTGYHMDADSVITQFVDREGNDVTPGEQGEIVYTSLHNYSMPFLRYSVGDVGRSSEEICPCGRTLPLMKVVEGRNDSFIDIGGLRLSPRFLTVAMSMFSEYETIDQFRIVQRKAKCIRLIIKLKGQNLDLGDFEKRLISHFQHMLRSIGDGLLFEVEFVDAIPLDPTGRLRAVISETRGCSD